MQRSWVVGLSAGLLCLTSQAALAEALPARQPKALEALTHMGKYLHELQSFEVVVDTNTDQILSNGQLAQFAHSTHLLVQRPSHLKADVTGSVTDSSKHAYYDGKTFTLYTQPAGYYATVKAPATIGELMTDLSDRYDINLPLADLFFWGGKDNTAVTAASYLGDETIGGKTCEHYAYREKEIDWQLWIEKGDSPLPCKLNIVTLTDKARPQHTAVYHWTVSPAIAAESFEFVVPEGAKKIEIRNIHDAKAKAKKAQ